MVPVVRSGISQVNMCCYILDSMTKRVRNSHRNGPAGQVLSVTQRNAVISSVMSSLMSAHGSLHGNLESFSPGKCVPHDARSSRAVGRLMDKTRRGLMMDSVPSGMKIDRSEGAMIKLAESMSLRKLIERHNNVHDPFHLDEHQTLCLGYQFKINVWYMCVSTASMFCNLARGINTEWQIYLHGDAGFNWCKKETGLFALGPRLRCQQHGQALQSSVNQHDQK